MGVADRDYMRDVPVYRDLTRSHTRAWVLAILTAAAAVAGLTQLHLGGAHTRLSPPSLLAAPHRYVQRAPASAVAGTVMESSGTVPADLRGIVTLEARWDGGPWRTLATADTRDGSYRLRYVLDRPGAVDLRLTLPNGDEALSRISVTTPASGAGPTA
jgi:hypothetical protein